MKLIKPKAELLIQPSGLEGVYKQIELSGRTCYKSTDKITEDSAKPFVDRMIASNHLAMLEHGTVYLKYPGTEDFIRCHENPYSRIKLMVDENFAVTTNLRVLVENDWIDDLQYICEPTKFHEKRYTFRLTTDRGVSHELVRHRVFSFAQESQRYCNYSKDKYGNEITFCIPQWLPEIKEGSYTWKDYFGDWRYIDITSPMEDLFIAHLFHCGRIYFELIKKGWQPQQARAILPNSTKTEIIMTGFASDWKHFFDLRLFEKTGKVHPDMKHLANLMKEEAEKQGIWEDIINK